MDAFLQIFGDFTIADVVTIIVALCFLVAVYYKLKNYFDKQHDKEDVINNILTNYSKWHQQSLEIQKQFTDAISELKRGQEQNAKRLEQIDTDNKKREQNRLRDRLLQSYRYYTSVEKNPEKAWTEMEKDTFNRCFKDYENLGGDGYMHTEVEPAMVALDVVFMHETDKIEKLMRSRK